MSMTKGCKIWLWLLMFGGVISVLTGLVALSQSTSVGIYTMCMGLLQLGAVSLLLFKQRKEGFYLLCAIDSSSVIYTLQISHNLNILCTLFSSLFISDTTMTENILMVPGEQEGLPRATRMCVDHRGRRLVCSHSDSNILSLYRIDNSCQMYLM